MADVLATVAVDRERARVYEHGWQSWSPTTAYRLDERPFRPVSDLRRVGNYRPERTAPDDAFWGEGLLAVDPGTGDGRARLRRAVGLRAHPVDPGRGRRGHRRGECRRRGHVSRARRGTRASTAPSPGGPTGSRPRRASARCGRRPRPGAPGTTTSSGSPRTTSRRTCARSTTWAWTSTSSRSTTGTRPRSATGCSCPTGSRRWRTSSAASAGPAAVPASGSRRSWWASGRCSPGSTPTGWSGTPNRAPGGGTSASSSLDATHPGAEAYLREVFGTFRELGHRLLQDRLHLRRSHGGTAGASRGCPASRPTGRGCGVIREAIGPRRLPARLRRADPAQRRAGRRHAGRSGHRPPLRAARRRSLAALPAGRGAEHPVAGAGSTAGSG